MKLELAGVNSVPKKTKNGIKWYYYHRATGTRLPDDPASSEFLLALEIANRGDGPVKETPKGETLAGLIHAYQASPNFKKLAKNSKSAAYKYLSEIGGRYGKSPLSAFNEKKTRAELLAWRDEIAADMPATAQQLFANFRRLLAFGDDRGLLEQNILLRTQSVYSSDRSEIIWARSQVSALLKVTNPAVGNVVQLALHTGQRQGDLLRWKWSDYHDDMLWLKQSKSKARVNLPIHGNLHAFLASLPRSAETILANPRGKPWNQVRFRVCFVEAMRRADLEGLHFHDLRGTAVTVMANAGMTEAQIAAVTGHSLAHISTILKKYLKRTTSQAQPGMVALGDSWIGQLQT